MTTQTPPLLYDLDKDPGEAYPLPPTLYVEVIQAIDDAVQEHKANLVKGESLLDTFDAEHANVPCCDAANDCICNYDHTPGVPACYEKTQTLADVNITPWWSRL